MYYGCKQEINDRRDYKLFTTKAVNYPEQFSLQIGKIKDQGIVSSCVAHTLASFLEQQNIVNDTKFSTGFIYGYRPEGYSQDQGMYPRQAVKTLKDIGDVLKEDFDHNKEMKEIKDLVDRNLENLKNLANKFRIKSYSRIYTENEIKNCIMNNVSVPVSVPVYGDIELDNNIIQITNKEITGYHMMLIYGWDEKGFLVQNSWR